MREAFVIEIDDLSVGLVQRERGGFRFFAAHADFWSLDGQVFRSVWSAQKAAERRHALHRSPPRVAAARAGLAL